jgi:hypothetical protein
MKVTLRLLGLLAGASVLAAAATAATPMASTPLPVKASVRNEIYPAFGGEYLTWSKSRRAGSSPYDAYIQRGTSPAVKLNAKGTQGYAGGMDGLRVAYQETRGVKSDIRLFDLATRRRSTPKGVNTKRWEWRPSVSGDWLLFNRGMIFSSAVQQVLLKNLVTGELRVLDSVKSKNAGLQVGQVNGNYAVWMRCEPGACNVLRYDIAAATKTQLPTSGKLQYSPSVSTLGTTYFGRSGPNCGDSVELVKVTLTGLTTVLYSLPPGKDFQSSFAATITTGGPPPSAIATTRVYFDLARCRPARADVYSIDDTEQQPPPP